MKKTITVLMAVFLAAMLIISCDNSTSEPKDKGSSASPSEKPSTVTPVTASKAVATLEELKDAAKTEGSYYLTADISFVGNLEITAPITLDGKDKTISVDYVTTCKTCNSNRTITETCTECFGSGQKNCSQCNGSGHYDGDVCDPCCGSGKVDCPENVTSTCSTCNGEGKAANDNADTGLVIKSEGVTLKNIKFVSTSAGANNNAQVTIKANGTEAKPVVIDTCSFDSGKTMDKEFHELAILSYDGSGAYLTVKKCTIKNMEYGMYFNQLSNAEISGNTIDGTKYNGINIAADDENYPCSDIDVKNNTLTNISYANSTQIKSSCGIYAGKQCSDIIIKDNNITMLHSKTDVVKAYLN